MKRDQLAGTSSYVYDADGTQLIRRDPGSTTLYLPGEEITRDNSTGTLTGTRYYTHNGTVVALRVGGANISYLQADQHGTTQVSVKAESIDDHQVTRRSFDPYGNPLGSGIGVWPDAHGFLNKPHNPTTGLTDVGARTYDPVTGRFQSVDPLLDTADPRTWTGYAYANNNPTTFADPSGRRIADCEEYHTNCSTGGNLTFPNPADQAYHNGVAAKASIDHLISNQLAEPALPNASKEATKQAVGVFRGWGYEGSEDYNYLDAIEFALKNKAGFDQFCKMVAQMPSGDCDRMMYEAHPEGTFWEQMRFAAKFGLAWGGLLFGSVLMADMMPVGLGAKGALEYASALTVRAAATAPVPRLPAVGDLMAQVPKGETLATWESRFGARGLRVRRH